MRTRRAFVASLATAPMILGAQNKSGSSRPIVGNGEHTYEVIHDWGALPANIRYGNTHGVVEDSQGRIYVHHTVHSTSESADSMVVFDADGKFVDTTDVYWFMNHYETYCAENNLPINRQLYL